MAFVTRSGTECLMAGLERRFRTVVPMSKRYGSPAPPTGLRWWTMRWTGVILNDKEVESAGPATETYLIAGRSLE
ncbi:hypothetical protein Tdes44962_MAKER02865 [Teratosphaeria destructans]|uniref:Uncharacterized protein n=1 Tax=Teratosphaeria destructans TaxID=418781 RepID=A0A9W7SRH2_9PEZI|nr:hypothetical protein Tdes44962_MAKER02865 [Teratosphaeria destructans]